MVSFQSTLSLRRATRRRNDRRGSHLISIHALLAESDADADSTNLATVPFQSTLSLRRATIPPGLHHFPNRNFNPRSPCGERPGPLTGPAPLRYFNPRSPCGERPGPMVRLNSTITFQSTLSLRRATSGVTCSSQTCFNFNPRSPCGERPLVVAGCGPFPVISIHALLAESD